VFRFNLFAQHALPRQLPLAESNPPYAYVEPNLRQEFPQPPHIPENITHATPFYRRQKCQEEVGGFYQHRIHSSSRRAFQQERRDHRPDACLQKSLATRSPIRHEHAELLHQSRRPWPQRIPPSRTRESQRPPLSAHRSRPRKEKSRLAIETPLPPLEHASTARHKKAAP